MARVVLVRKFNWAFGMGDFERRIGDSLISQAK